jgi:hypothetical protein
MKFFGTINQVSRWMLDLAGARPPRSTAKLLKAPLSPLRDLLRASEAPAVKREAEEDCGR